MNLKISLIITIIKSMESYNSEVQSTMDLSAADLRKVSLDTRHKASKSRLNRYSTARDEAFEVITKNARSIMLSEAEIGKFKARIYEWVSERRNDEIDNDNDNDNSTDKSTEGPQLRFGETDEDEGLHLMTLVSPTGIPYHEAFMTHLKNYFNGNVSTEGDTEESHTGPMYSVYFSRNPKNMAQCGIWVSWETKNRRMNGGRGGGRGGRGRGNMYGRGSGTGSGTRYDSETVE